jgi:hypothetical protein
MWAYFRRPVGYATNSTIMFSFYETGGEKINIFVFFRCPTCGGLDVSVNLFFFFYSVSNSSGVSFICAGGAINRGQH